MKLTNKRVLITGAAGFIGSHLVDELGDCDIRALDDFSTGKHENVAHHEGNKRVEIITGNILDQQLLDQVMAGVDVVFHLACRGVRHSIGHPLENHEVNATGALRLLSAARRSGVRRFVHISSSEVYGTARYAPMDEDHPTFPETVYGASKLAGECYSRAFYRTYGFPTVVVRPFNNFGPRSHHEGDSGEVIPRFVVWALNGQSPVIFGDGEQARDFIYVKDTAYWLRKIAESEVVGETINLAAGVETTIRQLAQLVCHAVGRPDIEPRFAPPRPGDVRRLSGGVARARQLLGFMPRTTLREGIERLIEDMRAKPSGITTLLAELPTINWTEKALTEQSTLCEEDTRL